MVTKRAPNRSSSANMLGFPAMTEAPSDASVELIVRAQGGDEGALDRLLERYLPRLRRWATGRLPASMRTLLDTGDLVQDAVVNALKHLDTLQVKNEGALFAYLRQAVNNRIIDLYRRRSRRPERQELPLDLVSSETSPLEAAIGHQALERYEQALARLTDDDRQSIVLRVELGLDYAAVAAAMQKPSAAAARMACGRAIGRLAQEMRRIG